MATFIKAGFWEQLCKPCKGYKGWLNLDEFVDSRIPTPPPSEQLYYGAFHSEVDQTSTANVSKPMEYEVIELTNGISIQPNALGKYTKITIAQDGIYNIQFSAQLHNTDGGGGSVHADIWLSQGGNPVSNSATKVSVTPNSPYMVAAWNFFVNASAGDYYEIIWQPSITPLIIEYEAAVGDVPAIPSVILTVNRVG